MAELSTLGSVIKAAYEGRPNTNAYTDAEKSKLSGIEAGATALEIGTTSSTAKAGDYVPAWEDVTGKPSFSDVATSGAYSDLSGTPSIPNDPGDIGAATSAQGAKADSAVQPADLAPYAKTADLPQGEAVADAAGDPPTQAEFNALLASLRTAGLIAT